VGASPATHLEQPLHIELARDVKLLKVEWLARRLGQRLEPQHSIHRAAGEVVDDRHVVAALVEEHQRKVRGDEARAAGDEHVGHLAVHRPPRVDGVLYAREAAARGFLC